MKLGEIQKCYDALRQVISPINKSTGLDWQIGGGAKVTLWVDIPTDFKNAGVQKQVSDGLQAIVKKYLPSEVPMEMLEIGAEGNQAWVDFRNSAMSRISVEDFLKLGKAIVKEGSDVIMGAFGGVEAPTESRKRVCSMQKKKESLAKMQEFTKNDDSVFNYIMKSTAHNALVETIGEICTLALDATLDDNPQVGPDTVKTIENNAMMAYKEYQSVIKEIIVRIAKQFTYQKSGR